MWAGFAAYLGVLAMAPRLGSRVIWGAIVLLLVGFAALSPPLLSHDIYSYIDYARLGALHGIDPYLRGPAAAPRDPAFSHVTWPHTTSAYGPLFTLATYPLAWISVGAAVWVLKAIAGASVLALAVISARLAAARGVDPLRAAAFVALNPLVLVHVVGGGHNDALATVLMMLGVAATLSAREISAGVALVAGAAIKLSAGLAAPFALLGSRRRTRLLGAGVGACLAIALLAAIPFGTSWLSAIGLATYNQKHTSHLSIPTTTARITGVDSGLAGTIALVLFAAAFIFLLVWTWRGSDWLRAAAWASLAVLLATSWLLPWYLIWSLPLAALSRDRVLQLLILALTAFQLGARLPT